MADIFDFSQQANPFKPEPLPRVTSCGGSPSAQQIIEKDGGVPE
jgi:hypothetical protein